MELFQEELPTNSITSYNEQAIIINHNSGQNTVNMPCFISNTYIQSPVTLSHLNTLVHKSNIEILIIGSKTPLHPKKIVEIKGIVECESMNIVSGIYSYNILISDMRNAGVLLLKD